MRTGRRHIASCWVMRPLSSTSDIDFPLLPADFMGLLLLTSLLRGLSEAVSTMREGGVRRIVIPQSLGYTDGSKRGPEIRAESGSEASESLEDPEERGLKWHLDPCGAHFEAPFDEATCATQLRGVSALPQHLLEP